MTIPSIPDSSYKFLLYAGLVLMGYGFIQDENLRNDFNSSVEKLNSIKDSLTMMTVFQEKKQNDLKKVAEDLAKRKDVKNPISNNDSLVYFTQTLRGPKNELYVSDSLSKLWNEIKELQFQYSVLQKRIELNNSRLDEKDRDFKKDNWNLMGMIASGFLLAVIGFIGLQKVQNYNEQLLSLEIQNKQPKNQYCQSCGKYFNSMLHYGHNEGGDINPSFCIECFDKGKFMEPSLSVEEFKQRIKNIIGGVESKSQRKLLIKHFNSLERWQPDKYS
jgi:hypothetical protein